MISDLKTKSGFFFFFSFLERRSKMLMTGFTASDEPDAADHELLAYKKMNTFHFTSQTLQSDVSFLSKFVTTHNVF